MKIKHLLIAAVALVACYDSSYGLTRTEIRQRLRLNWGEFVSTNSYYPDSVLNLAIADAEYNIAHFGRALERDTVIHMLGATEYYSLPSMFDGHIALYRHSKNTAPVMIPFVDQKALSSGVTSSTPLQQFTIYNSKLYVFPTASSDGDSVRLLYFAFPTPMSADTSTCSLGEYWSRLVPIVANDLIRLKDMPAESIIQIIRPKIEEYRRNYIEGVVK